MTIQLGIAISLVTGIVSVLGFLLVQKKNIKDETKDFGIFMGEIKTELKYIKEAIEELKTDGKGISLKINEAIKNHERIYHNGKN